MKLGISSYAYAYAWAIGVPGWEPPVPMTAFDVLAKAARQSIQVVQIADNLALDRLSEATLEALKAYGQGMPDEGYNLTYDGKSRENDVDVRPIHSLPVGRMRLWALWFRL